jgi:glycine/D-amino acid oxidase-like deaminating enzyme
VVEVVVVGAGIVGASIAYHAARRGAPVTLLDRSRPGSGVTGGSFGWVGSASGDWPGGAQDLRAAVLGDYRRLEAELPGVRVRWTGSLAWGSSTTGAECCGPGQRVVASAELLALEPHLRSPPPAAVFTASDGAVDAVDVTEALLAGARDHGAQVRSDTEVTALQTAGGRVVGVESSAGVFRSDVVVLASGSDAPALCQPLGIALPVTSSPAVLVEVAATAGRVRGVVATPDLEVREARDGRLLVTVPYPAGAGAREPHVLAAHARRLVGATLRDVGDLTVVRVSISGRPMPVDGGPIVGRLGAGAYVAVLHSAVTLGPTVGRLVADELLTGTDAPELRRCRPARFGPGRGAGP